jgi:hypothetical protein
MRDTLTGIGFILLIAALAGGIAYVGDRVGHQVGRKRQTLFGIRPRYTSTIVAIGTGVVIALIVTLGAIFASNEVKTAFFTLRTINDQIASLKQRAADAERKVNEAQIIVPLGQPLTINVARLPKDSPPDLREKIVRDYYASTVSNVNTSFPQLKPFQAPPDIDTQLRALADRSDVSKADVLVVAAADKNLFAGDRIHFGMTLYADLMILRSGEVITQATGIQAGPSANLNLAVQQLEQHILEQISHQKNIPAFLVGTPSVVSWYPSQVEMQKMLATGRGNFVMTAYAYQDIYPHTALQTGALPIVVALSQAP